MEISEKQKEIFVEGNDVVESGNCKFISLMDMFEVKGTLLYMVRYEGKFTDSNGRTHFYLYACFIDGVAKADAFPTQHAAEIHALTELYTMREALGLEKWHDLSGRSLFEQSAS